MNTLKDHLLPALTCLIWSLIVTLCIRENWKIIQNDEQSNAKIMVRKYGNPLMLSFNSISIRLLLQASQLISYLIMWYWSVNKKGGSENVARTKDFFIALIQCSSYAIALVFLTKECVMGATAFLYLMIACCWKILYDFLKRSSEMGSEDGDLLLKCSVVFIQNAIGAFSAFPFVMSTPFLNALFIYEYEISVISSSSFCLGILLAVVLGWGFLDIFYAHKYTSCLYTPNLAILWALQGMAAGQLEKENTPREVIFFTCLIIKAAKVLLLMKTAQVSYKLASWKCRRQTVS